MERVAHETECAFARKLGAELGLDRLARDPVGRLGIETDVSQRRGLAFDKGRGREEGVEIGRYELSEGRSLFLVEPAPEVAQQVLEEYLVPAFVHHVLAQDDMERIARGGLLRQAEQLLGHEVQ